MADLLTINKENPFQEDSLNFNFLQGINGVKQSIKTRFQTFKTEFYLNKNFGIDWYGVVLNQGVQPVEREAEINDMVRGTNGVQSLRSAELLRNANEKESVYLASVLSDGQILTEILPFDFLEP